MKKRTTIAALVGLAVFASSFAFAAGFGGLTSGTIGAANVTVAACDSDGVSTSYGASSWDATDERYEVATVTVSGVSDSCDGASMKVTVNDTGGAQLSEGTLTIPTSGATSFNVTLSPAASAAAVVGVHVAIGT
jgi:hypothetical protein